MYLHFWKEQELAFLQASFHIFRRATIDVIHDTDGVIDMTKWT